MIPDVRKGALTMSNFEFDTIYSAFTGERIDGLHVPTVEHDDKHDILIDGGLVKSKSGLEVNSGWDAIVGKTNQDRYHGAVLHPSETASDEMVMEWVREMDGSTFALVEVSACDHDGAPHGEECPCDACSDAVYCQEYGCPNQPAGWAIIYRTD